jgi:glycosyltransferase involved in cell wall biosynthesis
MNCSIIIPFYNRADFLIETLDSINKQDFNDFEVLIVDDGSKSIEIEIIKSALINYDDRFNFFRRPSNYPKGANGCRKYGFDIAKGKYIKWFDSDDLMSTHFLSSQIRDIENYNLDGVLGSCGIYDKDFDNKIKDRWRKKVFSEAPIIDYVRGQLGWQTGAGLWKKSSIAVLEPFSQDVSNAQEYIFHFFIITSNLKVGVREKELFYIRSHSKSISKKRDAKYMLNRFKARTITLNRLLSTGNDGKRFIFKSLLKMLKKASNENRKEYLRILWSISLKRKTVPQKINLLKLDK